MRVCWDWVNVGEGETVCFWLEQTNMVRLSVRRFTHGLVMRDGAWEEPSRQHRACQAANPTDTYWQGCDASVDLGIEIPLRTSEPDEYGYETMMAVPGAKRIKASDPRWPKVCERCGDPFEPSDIRQWNQAEVYIRSDTGERVAFRGYGDRSMAGALYDMWWRKTYQVKCSDGTMRGFIGPDGIALVAICPNGSAWEVDGPSRDGNGNTGPGWTRTGDPRNPPTLTVQPSIIAGKPGAPDTYHGFLQAGRFTAHIG